MQGKLFSATGGISEFTSLASWAFVRSAMVCQLY
jgi:hypothetical protein